MLPEYIHMCVAESVLFAGKAVRVLRNPSPAFQYQDLACTQQIPRDTQKIQAFAGRFNFQKEPLLDAKQIGDELLPQLEADKIEAMLQDLKVCFQSYHCRYHLQSSPLSPAAYIVDNISGIHEMCRKI